MLQQQAEHNTALTNDSEQCHKILVATNSNSRVRLFYCSQKTKICKEIIEINGIRVDNCNLTRNSANYLTLIESLEKVNDDTSHNLIVCRHFCHVFLLSIFEQCIKRQNFEFVNWNPSNNVDSNNFDDDSVHTDLLVPKVLDVCHTQINEASVSKSWHAIIELIGGTHRLQNEYRLKHLFRIQKMLRIYQTVIANQVHHTLGESKANQVHHLAKYVSVSRQQVIELIRQMRSSSHIFSELLHLLNDLDLNTVIKIYTQIGQMT